jgi:exodeoxyribonuclease VII small subunit
MRASRKQAAPDRFAKSAARKVRSLWPRRQKMLLYSALRRQVKTLAYFSCLFQTMAKTSDSPQTFEAALAELEEIVARMEGGQLPLKDALAAYKRVAELLTHCQASLKDAQAQVDVLEQGVRKSFEPEGSPAPESEPDAS